MSGIKAYGVVIPKRRIEAMAIWDVWKNVSKDILEKMGMKERTVTGPDEDSISLGAESGRRCLAQAGMAPETLDGLIFCSQTNPYQSKSAASVLQDILGLRHDVFVTDVQSASRSGFDGIRIAKSLIDGGDATNVLVIASDCLNQYMSPGHVYEYAAAAGAVALLISKEGCIAEIEGMTFASEDRANWYRLSGDRYMRLGAGFVGYISNWGLMDSLKQSWKTYVERYGVTPASFEHYALPQGTVVQAFMSSSAIGCDPYSALPYVVSEQTGDMGAAQVLISMCSILDLIDTEDVRIGVAGYGWGDGSSVMGIVTTAHIGTLANRPVVMPQLEAKEIIDYGKALKYEKKLDRAQTGLSSYY